VDAGVESDAKVPAHMRDARLGFSIESKCAVGGYRTNAGQLVRFCTCEGCMFSALGS
jgi:hypothetical protein